MASAAAAAPAAAASGRGDFSQWFAAHQSGSAGVSGNIAPVAQPASAQPADAAAAAAAAAGAKLSAGLSSLGSLLISATSGAATAAPATDVEAGAGGGAGGTPPAQSSADAWGAVAGLAALLPAALRAGAPVTAAGGAAPTPPLPEWTCGMSTAQRFQAFGLLLCASLALYFVSVFVFLPMVIIMPSKFATSFTFASIMWMAAFAILRGPRATLTGLLSDKDKRPFTAAYIGSLILTLYATVWTSSYFLILLAVLVQVSAMMWYMSASIPGGTTAMGHLSKWCLGSLVGGGSGAAGVAATTANNISLARGVAAMTAGLGRA